MLTLADLEDLAEEEVKEHLIVDYCAEPYGQKERLKVKSELDNLEILVAYESVGNFGCDSSSFFLFKHKQTRQLYELHGSHCSCYGFEGQFDLDETTLKYLQSRAFCFCAGGYDYQEEVNKRLVREFLRDYDIT